MGDDLHKVKLIKQGVANCRELEENYQVLYVQPNVTVIRPICGEGQSLILL
jgi:hypothetical protein